MHVAPGSNAWAKFQIFILASQVLLSIAPTYHSALITELLYKLVSPSPAKVVLFAPNFTLLILNSVSADAHNPFVLSKPFSNSSEILLKDPDSLKLKLCPHPNLKLIPHSFTDHVMVLIFMYKDYVQSQLDCSR